MDKETVNCRNVNQNPCNMCMPMGAILPFKGIEQTMVILHGSQGCATYMRRHIAEHFNEPIDVGSSSLNEKGTIYGGEKNLKQGLDNIQRVYQPKLIGVLTTCLAETIGEDIDRISSEYLMERDSQDTKLVTVPTPSYSESHSEGYWLAVKNIIAQITKPTEKHKKINVIVPNISPADIREVKRLLHLMDVEYTLIPDFSDTLDAPIVKPYKKMPEGGTKIEDIEKMSGAAATIQFGITVEDNLSPGKYLSDAYGVPLYNLPIPIGIENTDKFVDALQNISGREIPRELVKERGRLLDGMIDSHKYNFMGKAAIFGEPEMVYAITKTCLENGIFPGVVATGSKNIHLAELLKEEANQDAGEIQLLRESDFNQIRTASVEAGVNLAIGHSDGRFLTEKEGIPLVRRGFPIHDRVGGQRILTVGYTGTMMLLDQITNTLLERKLTNYRSSMYERFYLGNESEENIQMTLRC